MRDPNRATSCSFSASTRSTPLAMPIRTVHGWAYSASRPAYWNLALATCIHCTVASSSGMSLLAR